MGGNVLPNEEWRAMVGSLRYVYSFARPSHELVQKGMGGFLGHLLQGGFPQEGEGAARDLWEER